MIITYMIRVRCVLRGPSYHMTFQPKGVRNIHTASVKTLGHLCHESVAMVHRQEKLDK